jgi:membrane associated rhomboid family serine protease
VFPLKDNIPTDRFPVVTVGLIVANVVVFLLSIRHGGSLLGGPSACTVVDYGAIPRELTHPGDEIAFTGCPRPDTPTALTVLTSMFMHGGLLHIAGNMLFLWIFGNNVEDAMGRVKFLLWYLVGGAVALGLQTLVDPNSVVPTVGASGAVAAVLGGYILLYPHARVLTVIFIIIFFTLVELPALVMIGLWFVQQALFGAYGLTNPTGDGGGVAYFAHIGGFVFGLATIRLLATRVRKPIPPRFPVY